MSADEINKGDDPLEPPRAGTRTRGSAPMEADQDRAPEQDHGTRARSDTRGRDQAQVP